jgi:hypothetical protein
MSPQDWSFHTIDEYTFTERFGLRPNHLDSDASFDFGDGGCLFETYGGELAYVRTQDPRTVCTIIEGDEGKIAIESGMHFVNRLGFLITAQAIEDQTAYTVLLD